MIASSRALALGVALVLLPGVARADEPGAAPSEEQVEAGRTLYREARDLERQGRLREALDRGFEAYRTAPTPVTALLAGQLLAENGRLVEARELVRGVGGMPSSARETDKGREARQQAAVLSAALDMRIPKIAVAGGPAGAEVILDGKPLGSTDPGAWRGVDPGSHTLVARVGDRTCMSTHVTLAEGEERTIDLHDARATCEREAASAKAATPSSGAAPPPAAPEEGWRGRGMAIAGAGLVAIGVGTVLAVTAKHDYDSVASGCSPAGCDQNAFDVRNGARFRGDIATLVISVGLAAVVGGGVLWWTSPGPSAPGASAGPGGLGFRF